MYIGSNQITNILNIRNEAPERIRLICASTPSGKHEEYYRWCQDASKKYYPSEDDIKNNKFSGYMLDEKQKGEGNGWTNKKLIRLLYNLIFFDIINLGQNIMHHIYIKGECI